MLAIISINYWNWLQKSTPEQRAEFRERVPQANLTEDKDGKPGYMTSEFLADLATDGQYLLEIGIDFSIKRFKSCYRVDAQSAVIGQHTPKAATVTNIQVAIPNLLLWSIDEVVVLEDGCTDSLQLYLNDGWRILAICPPAAQRRPDYIIGRQKVRDA
jgi:hypothetical protein